MCSKARATPNSPPPSISELVVRIASQKAIFRASSLSNSATKPSEIGPIEDKQREGEVGRLLESRGMRADYDDGGGRGVCSSQEKEFFSTVALTWSSQRKHIKGDGIKSPNRSQTHLAR